MAKKKKLTAVSLFSGGGGLDWGFENAGFEILSAHDIDPLAVLTYNKNLKSISHLSDVSSPEFEIPKGVDLVISGSPCQGFSLVGKRNYHDPRNSLLLTACSLIAKARPRAVLFENVPGAIAGSFYSIWDSAVKALQKEGYKVSFESIPMNEYGIAQMRKRIFLVGVLEGNTFSLRNGLEKKDSISIQKALISAGNFSSSDLFHTLEPGSQDWEIAQHILPGMKLCDVRAGTRSVHSWSIPSVFGSTSASEKEMLMTILRLRRQLRRRDTGDADPVQIELLEKAYGSKCIGMLNNLEKKNYIVIEQGYVDLKRRFNGKYRRSLWNSHSYTVDTNFGNPKYFLHPEEHRGFSVREAARIQGFPDHFEFLGSMKDRFRIIGNAVPPFMALQIANKFKSALN